MDSSEETAEVQATAGFYPGPVPVKPSRCTVTT
jgi:hypothetical protein